jgi:DHA2 family multidrug resistance protein
MAQTLVQRRDQFHLARLGESLDPFNPTLSVLSRQVRAFFLQLTGDPGASRQMTWQALANRRFEQAASMAYFDVFWLFAVLALALVFLVPLMKRSVAEKGAHVGAE